jgi:DNA-binding GntR family transcriptional regulator
VDHRLKAGTKLGEQALAKALGVSRTVIRQAIILLAGERLVSIKQNRGAFVSEPEFQEALDICEALIMIEQAVAAHLIRHLNSSDWMALRRHVAKRQTPTSRGLATRSTGTSIPCLFGSPATR